MNMRAFISLILIVLAIRPLKSATEKPVLNKGWALVGNPLLSARPCKGNDLVSLNYEPGRSPEEENAYTIHIREKLPVYSKIQIKFNSPATLTLGAKSGARISVLKDDLFEIRFYEDSEYGFNAIVKGVSRGIIPYVTSAVVNSVEYCDQPDIGILDKYIEGDENTAQTGLSVSSNSCGRRKVMSTELITSGLDTKPGDWPWHVALYRINGDTIKYICGGTLISKSIVVTAAHCVTIRGNPVIPESMSVVLGKFNLIGGDVGVQEKEIYQIVIHETYNYTRLDDDLAIIKLKSEAEYTDYVQPACLWSANDYKKLGSNGIRGKVVGWGFDHNSQLSAQLRQAEMPKVSESNCIKSHPLFFGTYLTNRKFCAGYRNGTSACNGDSGGGYMVFVPDESGDRSTNASGSWHVRGIVSQAISLNEAAVCDPNNYVLFTDLAKFSTWIRKFIS